MSGFIVAFAIAIMPGLNETGALSAVHSMNAINHAIGGSPLFFILFGGTGMLHIAGLVIALKNFKLPFVWLIICAAGIYLCGVLLVTLCLNIPLNKEMAGLDLTISRNDLVAGDILAKWIFWNQTRAVSSLLSVLLLAIYLRSNNHLAAAVDAGCKTPSGPHPRLPL
ncbi:anthrone oxygenase family protein [Paenibacillus chitinolyticus]|uniref:anthrone oxygenase family protein n=1 Tax=Paenibacillus chitinolyticus TaxID=79263 RepID=UPI003670FBFE